MDLSAVEKDLAGQSDRKTQLTAKSSTRENQIVTRKSELDKLFSDQNVKRESLHELTNQIRQKEHNIELKSSQMKQARQDIQSAVQEPTIIPSVVSRERSRATARQTPYPDRSLGRS